MLQLHSMPLLNLSEKTFTDSDTVLNQTGETIWKKKMDCSKHFICAASWQNQQSDCAPSEDSARVFAVRMKKAWILSYPLSTQQRLWSDWADTQADLSLRWVHTHFVDFVVLLLIFPFLDVHSSLERISIHCHRQTICHGKWAKTSYIKSI